jgi:hypothetical protein
LGLNGNHVLLPFSSQEKGLGDEMKGNCLAEWKVVSSSPFVKLAFARIPQGDVLCH